MTTGKRAASTTDEELDPIERIPLRGIKKKGKSKKKKEKSESEASDSEDPFDGDSDGYLFRGDKNYKGGSVGVPKDREITAEDIIDHVKQTKTGNPAKSFSTKRSKGTANDAGAAKFGGENSVYKVKKKELKKLQESGDIRIITPDEAYKILKNHPDPKIQKRAGDIRQNMKRNNEVLIQGEIPSNVYQKAK